MKAFTTGMCLVALAALASPTLANSCLPDKQALKTGHMQIAHRRMHETYRVAERRARERDYERPGYDIYDDRAAPDPYYWRNDGGYWVWHPGYEEVPPPWARW